MRIPQPDQVEKLTKALQAGTPPVDSCLYAGITLQDYNEWRARGRAYQQALADPDAVAGVLDADDTERPYLDFLVDTDAATATNKVRCTATISQAIGAGDWRPAAWMLERTDPVNFGRKVLQQVDGGDPLADDVGPIEAQLQQRVRIFAAEHQLEMGPGEDDDVVVEATIVGE